MRFHHTTCSAARRSSCEGASSTFLMFLYGAWNAFHSHLQKDRPLNFSVQHATMFPGSRHYDVNWNIFVTTWLSDIKRQLCRKISVGFSLPVQVYNDCFHRMWNASSDLFSLVLKCQNHIAGYRHTWHCARLFWIVKSVVVCVHAFEESTEGCYKTDPVLRFFGKVAFANFRKSRMRLFFASLCTKITRRQIELEICSNHLKIRKIFYFRSVKMENFGFQVLGYLKNGEVYAILTEVTDPGSQHQQPIYDSWICSTLGVILHL